MGACDDTDTAPLLHATSTSSSSTNETEIKKPHFQRNGTMWTALAHIITAVIGSGVLSLAWSMSQLGWIAGPLLFLLFAFVTLIAAFLLSDCYKSPDPRFGPTRNASYIDAVQMILENGDVKGSVYGVPASSAAEKTWSIAQAIGNVAFAFPFSSVFLDIQNTLKSPPQEEEEVTMRKTSIIAVCIITTFYFSCGGFGYAGFGNSTPGNILSGFDLHNLHWLLDFANACVILHLVGAYQVYSQPLFANVERWFANCFPESRIVHDELSVKLPSMPTVRLNVLRLCFRTVYVASVTGIAMLFPYFNQVVGVAGSINFWPITVYFPIEMYLVQKNIGSWTTKSIILRIYSAFCLIVTLFAFIGSVKELISARFH